MAILMKVGDWGEIDKNTGNFVREGNIFKDSECAPLLSETASNLEELVKKGNPEGTSCHNLTL
jgi:hypothetical protein